MFSMTAFIRWMSANPQLPTASYICIFGLKQKIEIEGNMSSLKQITFCIPRQQKLAMSAPVLSQVLYKETTWDENSQIEFFGSKKIRDTGHWFWLCPPCPSAMLRDIWWTYKAPTQTRDIRTRSLERLNLPFRCLDCQRLNGPRNWVQTWSMSYMTSLARDWIRRWLLI